MTVSTTYRANARTTGLAYLTAFQAANPTLLLAVSRARPGSIHAPCAWIGDWGETVDFSMQLLTREPQIEFWFVQGEYDNAQTMDAQDVLDDAWLSYISNNPHFGNGVIISASSSDREVTFGGPGGSTATYLATVWTLGLNIQEGGL